MQKALKDMNCIEANAAQYSTIAALNACGVKFSYDATSSNSEIWYIEDTVYFVRGKNDNRSIRDMIEVESHRDMLIRIENGL